MPALLPALLPAFLPAFLLAFLLAFLPALLGGALARPAKRFPNSGALKFREPILYQRRARDSPLKADRKHDRTPLMGDFVNQTVAKRRK